ncbi:MAG: hypothetical protein IJH63_00805 [Methanobrevibacter sp.]|nr:hypothetical protein [Methanosphaera sp.]MBR0369244.1 hypothetical protein [Methanobrevibacter sp.]
MTEKRFKLGYVCGDYGLIDNSQVDGEQWIDLHSMSENSEKNVQICINKMNELADENEHLKQFKNLARDYNIPFNKLIDTFEDVLNSDTVTTLETEVAKLKEENKQLKSQMDNVHTKSNLKAINSHKKTMGLMEENEWLKQQLKEFKGDV